MPGCLPNFLPTWVKCRRKRGGDSWRLYWLCWGWKLLSLLVCLASLCTFNKAFLVVTSFLVLCVLLGQTQSTMPIGLFSQSSLCIMFVSNPCNWGRSHWLFWMSSVNTLYQGSACHFDTATDHNLSFQLAPHFRQTGGTLFHFHSKSVNSC